MSRFVCTAMAYLLQYVPEFWTVEYNGLEQQMATEYHSIQAVKNVSQVTSYWVSATYCRNRPCSPNIFILDGNRVSGLDGE